MAGGLKPLHETDRQMYFQMNLVDVSRVLRCLQYFQQTSLCTDMKQDQQNKLYSPLPISDIKLLSNISVEIIESIINCRLNLHRMLIFINNYQLTKQVTTFSDTPIFKFMSGDKSVSYYKLV